jgi:PAS domain S-box-containing protein
LSLSQPLSTFFTLFSDEFFPDNLDFSSLTESFGVDCDSMKKGAKSLGDLDLTGDIEKIFSSDTPSTSMSGLAASKSLGLTIPEVQPPASKCQGVIVVPLPSSIPRVTFNDPKASLNQNKNVSKAETSKMEDDFDEDDSDDEGQSSKKKKISGDVRLDSKGMSHSLKLERRERNREHAKRSRIRKKVLLDSLQDQLQTQRTQNAALRKILAEKVPSKAQHILMECTTSESLLLSDNTLDLGIGLSSNGSGPAAFSSTGQPLAQGAKILVEPDFRLIQSLMHSQQNFCVSDPSLPDNPIVYCSEGFSALTGYKRHEVLGRNCRFLQGPGTDQKAVEIIRRGVSEGSDISVCLLNYKADGRPFWNNFFVGSLKDGDGNIVNHVGVQCEVNTLPISDMKDRVKKLPMPDCM